MTRTAPKEGGRAKESLSRFEERLEAARRKTICKGDTKTAQEENTDRREIKKKRSYGRSVCRFLSGEDEGTQTRGGEQMGRRSLA